MRLNIDLTSFLPDSIVDNIHSVYGVPEQNESSDSFASFLGAGGFVDNTVGISPEGDIYVIGGGRDQDSGAVVRIKVTGTADEPHLEKGWYTPTHAGSATSPSISPAGQYLVVSDGSSMDTFIRPDNINAEVKVMDIFKCNRNTDSNPDPNICGVAYSDQIQRAPMIGAPAIDDDGIATFWELSLSWTNDASDRDLAALGPNGLMWETALPDNRDWTSVITVTDNHLIGSGTKVRTF